MDKPVMIALYVVLILVGPLLGASWIALFGIVPLWWITLMKLGGLSK